MAHRNRNKAQCLTRPVIFTQWATSKGTFLPTRYLKPGIRDSEIIDSLNPSEEAFFYRLLVTVDDFGRFDARPAMLKAQCYPVKESVTPKHCSVMLKGLANAGLILLYEVSNQSFLQIKKWDNLPRAKESKYPQPYTDAIQVYADDRVLHTDVPLTVTETETKTETETETKTIQSAYADLIIDIDQQVINDWKKLRAAKRSPVTRLVIEGLIREAGLAGYTLEQAMREGVERGWTSFKASWVVDKGGGGAQSKGRTEGLSFRERDEIAAQQRYAEATGKIVPQTTTQKPFLDIQAKEIKHAAIDVD